MNMFLWSGCGFGLWVVFENGNVVYVCIGRWDVSDKKGDECE